MTKRSVLYFETKRVLRYLKNVKGYRIKRDGRQILLFAPPVASNITITTSFNTQTKQITVDATIG